MIKVKVESDEAREGLNQLEHEITGPGLERLFLGAALTIERFIKGGNIEVRKPKGGTTENSIFTDVKHIGNGVEAMLGTNIHYSPYVRDAGHRKQFFEYAAEVEAPVVLDQLGLQVEVMVNRAFS